jgi:hypothetical protein
MNRVLSNFSFLTVAVLLLFQSCAQRPIKRRGTGYAPRYKTPFNKKSSEYFSPIKKKIALLAFYNESPFGKEDLAITATEEFRRELSRTRDFVIDPEASSLFGTSKEIYAGGGIKLAQLSRKAKLSGVNLVIFGRITHARVRQKTDEIGFVLRFFRFFGRIFLACYILFNVFYILLV